MVEVDNYQIKDLKLSLAVSTSKRSPSWIVRLNDKYVSGGSNVAYQEALKVYHALKHSIDIIARELWNYLDCEICELLVPSAVITKVWYDTEEGTRDTWDPVLCPECVSQYRTAGNLKK